MLERIAENIFLKIIKIKKKIYRKKISTYMLENNKNILDIYFRCGRKKLEGLL